MSIEKIKTYVGFAIKSNEIIYGVDNLKTKKTHLIILSEDISQGSKQKCYFLSEKNNCGIYEIKSSEMSEIINNKEVKAFGIGNKELAKAIVKYLA